MIKHAIALARQGFDVFPLTWIVKPAPEALAEALRIGTTEAFKAATLKAECSCGKPDCRSPGKHPLTRFGAHSATNDRDQVEAWWEQFPHANIGIRVPPGSFVLDFDWKKPGSREYYQSLTFPVTRRASSGYGEHVWLEGEPPGASKFTGGDIITHAHRYVVAPPSLHWSGEHYAWLNDGPTASAEGLDLTDRPTMRASADVAAAMRTPTPRRPPSRSEEEHAEEICRSHDPARDSNTKHATDVEPGSSTLIRLGCHLIAGLGLDPDTATDIAWELYNPRCLPPWTDEEFDEFERLIHSAGRDATIGYLQPTEGELNQHLKECRAALAAAKVKVKEAAIRDREAPSGPAYEHLREATREQDDAALALDRARSELTTRKAEPIQTIRQGAIDLVCNADGKPLGTIGNVFTLLENHPAWSGVISWDALGARAVALKDGPGEHCPAGAWTDQHTTYARLWMSREYRIEVASPMVDESVQGVAIKNIHHPVQDYFATLTWDGTSRIDRLLAEYFGCKENEYHRRIGRNFLLSCVARAHEPGCKVDTMLILEGVQGARKSTAFRALAGPAWFADSSLDLRYPKEAAQQIVGKWIYEMQELDAMSRTEITSVKAFLSQQVDTYRPSYGRRSLDTPRGVVFVGTTNESRYLRDTTGNRRFWPATVKQIDLPGIARDRDQIWAEALEGYISGERWWFEPHEEASLAAAEQQSREIEGDPWEETISDWAAKRTEPFTISACLSEALAVFPSKQKHGEACRAGAILCRLGFERARIRQPSGARVTMYARKADEE